MKNFSMKMRGIRFIVGEEDEISGMVSVDPSLGFIYFSDGFTKYPALMLHYCPYCGKKQS